MKQIFNALVQLHINQKVSINEVFLFTLMMHLFNRGNAKSCFVKSVHGRRGFVEFSSQITGRNQTKEIADLQILNYNRKRKELRLCFVQAKYKRTPYGTTFLDFNGDSLQHELLLRRCSIVDKYNNGFPSNILSFTNYKTITSFGVFYKDANNDIDFLFTLPDYIKPVNPTKTHTTMRFRGSSNCPNPTCHCGVYPLETISTCSMDFFEHEVLRGNIGAPIDNSIHTYITRILKSIYQDTNLPLAAEILSYQNENVESPFEYVPYMDTYLLVTNGVEDEEYRRIME